MFLSWGHWSLTRGSLCDEQIEVARAGSCVDISAWRGLAGHSPWASGPFSPVRLCPYSLCGPQTLLYPLAPGCPRPSWDSLQSADPGRALHRHVACPQSPWVGALSPMSQMRARRHRELRASDTMFPLWATLYLNLALKGAHQLLCYLCWGLKRSFMCQEGAGRPRDSAETAIGAVFFRPTHGLLPPRPEHSPQGWFSCPSSGQPTLCPHPCTPIRASDPLGCSHPTALGADEVPAGAQ